MTTKLASLDVGSNTVRLLIAEVGPRGDFHPLRAERIITRLGGDFSESGKLAPQSVERTIAAIRGFADLCRSERAEKILAAGTGVLRAAANREEFLEEVKRQTSVSLRVLSGEEEASLMLRGVLRSIPDKDVPRLVADIGGWSTEILWAEREVARETVSLNLGVVSLTETFMKHDPPLAEDVESLENRVRDAVREVRKNWERKGLSLRDVHSNLAGTAGTATTLAAIDQGLAVYDPGKINGHRISLERLRSLSLRLRSLSSKERLNIPGLEKGREDLIVAGTAVMIILLEVFDRPRLEVVDSGLLEGLLIEGIKTIGDRGLAIAD